MSEIEERKYWIWSNVVYNSGSRRNETKGHPRNT